LREQPRVEESSEEEEAVERERRRSMMGICYCKYK
jgi:hypothetical protein